MPAYAEMLVSQSPPIYNHSLVDYISSQTGDGTRFGCSPTRSFCRPASLQLSPLPLRRQVTAPSSICPKMPASPRRSCLVVRPEDLSPEEETTIDLHHGSLDFAHDKHRNKKKVVFADDQGGQLTQVRVMKEPSYMPPIWSLQFLAHVTQGMISPVPQEQWVVDFRQPASAYLEFRQKVEEKKVSLENVIIKETEHLIVGTVKVKNINYNKEVIVRSTNDAWKTHQDTYCTYTVVGSGLVSAYTTHDTFSFRLTLPPKSRRIEFCVCYKCDAGEFWDNNDGRNYSLTNRVMPRQESSIFFPSHTYNSSNRTNSNSTSLNSTNTTSSPSNCSSQNSSQYVDHTVDLDTWRHMHPEAHDGPYCSDIGKETEEVDGRCPESTFIAASQLTRTSAPSLHCTSNQQPQPTVDAPSKTPPSLTRSEPIKVVTPASSPLAVRRTSCADQFASRQKQFNSNRASYPRASGQQHLIRDRQEDLMANLLNLRDLLLNQNVPV